MTSAAEVTQLTTLTAAALYNGALSADDILTRVAESAAGRPQVLRCGEQRLFSSYLDDPSV